MHSLPERAALICPPVNVRHEESRGEGKGGGLRGRHGRLHGAVTWPRTCSFIGSVVHWHVCHSESLPGQPVQPQPVQLLAASQICGLCGHNRPLQHIIIVMIRIIIVVVVVVVVGLVMVYDHISTKNPTDDQLITDLYVRLSSGDSECVRRLVVCICSRNRNIFLVWPWTLTYDLAYEIDLNDVKVNQYVIYWGQRSFRCKTDTLPQQTDCCTCTTEVVSKNLVD